MTVCIITKLLLISKLEDEEVHHIDGDPFHYEHCNLIIMKKHDHEILSRHMINEEEKHYPKFEHWSRGKDNGEAKTTDEQRGRRKQPTNKG